MEEINRAKKIRHTLSQELQNQQNEESAAVFSTLPLPPPPQPHYYSQGILPLPSCLPPLFPPWHTQMHPSQPSNIYPQRRT
ncbi:hypothetical protein DB42_AZ00130 [Neochlamydia sp. EPS4]|uniref:hypothetical protein n=1 Tax=Neochlamydia sp. EPS4 TaxID=1478175 RepID=UPI0005830364|nr:hypothetical protein [Neochlamydia sp. EPS4]KIC74658.1 hypothetical protein DB42_AZ00130 [Neochlamydia sp. EPS4]